MEDDERPNTSVEKNAARLMIIFDANVLITFVQAAETDDIYERLSGFVQDLITSRTVIGVPAPA